MPEHAGQTLEVTMNATAAAAQDMMDAMLADLAVARLFTLAPVATLKAGDLFLTHGRVERVAQDEPHAPAVYSSTSGTTDVWATYRTTNGYALRGLIFRPGARVLVLR